MQVSGIFPPRVYYLYHLVSKQLTKLVVLVCVLVYHIYNMSIARLVSILNHYSNCMLGTSFCRDLDKGLLHNGPPLSSGL